MEVIPLQVRASQLLYRTKNLSKHLFFIARSKSLERGEVAQSQPNLRKIEKP